MRVSIPFLYRAWPLATGPAVFSMVPFLAQAQNVLARGEGPNEKQIGMDTNGPAPVPICIERLNCSRRN